jgi:hypothetical protein
MRQFWDPGMFFYRHSVLYMKKKARYTISNSFDRCVKLNMFVPCEQQVLIELAINSGDFW